MKLAVVFPTAGNCLQFRALPPLSRVASSEELCDGGPPITMVASPAMHSALHQGVPLQLQQLAVQLDTALSTAYKALGLAVCIMAATASSMKKLKSAEVKCDNSRKALGKIARSLLASDANATASQQVKYLEGVVAAVFERKRRLLDDLCRSQQLLQQATSAAAKACSQQDKQQLAAAMAAVTRAHDAEVHFGQLPDGDIYAVPQAVTVDFGAQLTGAPAQQRCLRIVNNTAAPLRLQLFDSPCSDSDGNSAVADLARNINVHRGQLLIAPNRQSKVDIIADTSAAAGKAEAKYLLAATSGGSNPVAVTVLAEYQKLSVSVDTAAVNFGTVLTYKPSVQRVVRITNNTGVAVRVKSMVQLPHGLRSRFSVEPADLTLQPYDRSCPLALLLHPSKSCSETIKDAKLLIAAGSAANTHEVPITAEVQQPKVQLRLSGAARQISPHDVVPVPSLQPGQQQQLNFELVNQGEELLGGKH